MSQRDEAWFEARLGKITGSRFADVMDITAKGLPGAKRKALIADLVIERITGEPVLKYQTAAMSRGIELEADAITAYELATGHIVEFEDFINHPALENVGVSPDGVIGGFGMVEIKCPMSKEKHLDYLLNHAHAIEYKWQVQGQMWVCERDWNDVTAYNPTFPPDLQLVIARVERDDIAIAKLAQECEAVENEINEIINQLERKYA